VIPADKELEPFIPHLRRGTNRPPKASRILTRILALANKMTKTFGLDSSFRKIHERMDTNCHGRPTSLLATTSHASFSYAIPPKVPIQLDLATLLSSK
jgi:hypothetical protein